MLRRKSRRQARRRRHNSFAEALEARTLLTTFTVTTLADTVADDDETSLREAIAEAAASDDHEDTVVFESGLSGTIDLQLGELDFSSFSWKNLTIVGNGRDSTVIDAGGNSDIFSRFPSSLTLRSMTLQNSAGHGIEFGNSYDRLTIDDAVITGSGQHGIAVSYYGSESAYYTNLTVTNSVITGNSGRGVDVEGAVGASIADSEISGNAGGIISRRGDEYAAPSLSVRNSVIRDNVTTGDGGGILISDGVLFLADSVVTRNEAADGGGVHVDYSYNALTISRSTISGNTASGDGGGLRIGRVGGGGDRRLDNLTVTGNTAARGGGIHTGPGHVDLANSTITGNNATDQGGGVFFDANPTRTVASNIVFGNSAANGGTDVRVGSTSSAMFEHNFIGTNDGTDLTETGLTADANGNFVGSTQSPLDPQLGPETTVGIQTVRRPLADSPVINTGSNPLDVDFDQLGVARSAESGVDIGAVELFSSSIVVAEASVTEGDSGTRRLDLEIQLAQATGSFTVDVVTVNGTATAGQDYQSHSETLSFSGTPGETKVVTVLVNGDEDFELSETVLLRFQNISDTSVNLPADAVGTIINDDTSNNIRLQGTKLIVSGTPNADTIDVSLNGQFVDVVLNDETGSFAAGDVTRIDITGDAGDDTITITGVTSETTILGGAGDDTIQGGPGKDRIFGGDGNDNLFGGSTRDIIRGEAGHDLILGEAGNDVIRGGDGQDTIQGGVDDDLIYGEGDADVIEGQDGNDKLRGGGGNDTLRGAAGEDSLGGGGGGDLLNGGDDADILAGSNGADRLNGGNGNDYMNGGQGQDTMVGGDGDDTLLGREGNDVLLGDAGNDYLNGLTEQDILYGGEGEDTLLGRASEDILIAGSITPPDNSTVRDLLIGGIRDEWLSGRSYAQRVANITDSDGQTSNRLNTEFLIGSGRNGQNVFNDGQRDELLGGSGSLDLFFARAGSDLFDKANSEFLEDI